MKKCPKCGTEYPDSLNFCMDCGKKLEFVPMEIGAMPGMAVPDLGDIRNNIASLREEIKKNREEIEKVKATKELEKAVKDKMNEVLSSDEARKKIIENIPKEMSFVKNQAAQIEWLRKTTQNIVNEVNKNRKEISEIRRGVGGGLPGIAEDLKAIKEKLLWLEKSGPAPVSTNMQMLLAKVQQMEKEIFMLKSAVPMIIE